MSKENLLKRITEYAAVAVIRLQSENNVEEIASALSEGGVNVLEITMTTPNALNTINNLVSLKSKKLIVGVGSVVDAKMAADAISAGAQFVVSPILKEEIVTSVKENNLPVMPGAFSPTEILRAYDMGADIVKVFPADVLGMSYFKSIKAPMPFLKLMPTGGVTLDNAGEWLAAGAYAVGVGSALVDTKAIREKNYKILTEKAYRLVSSINSYRNKHE